jgi:PAS domain S-box-containing protein
LNSASNSLNKHQDPDLEFGWLNDKRRSPSIHLKTLFSMKTSFQSLPTELAASEAPVALLPLRVLDSPQIHDLLEQIPDAILWLDRSWKIVFANEQARVLSRISSSDLNQKTHWELFPETVGTPLEASYRRAMVERLAEHIEYFYAPFNLWVDIHTSPIEDGIALYYRDISNRKFAEAARDEADRRLQQVFESAPDAIVAIDREWNCTFANLAARSMLKSDDLIGINLWTAYPGTQAEPFTSNYRTTMEHGVPTDFEAYYPAPLNIWLKVAARPFEDGMLIFASDITSRKEAEERRDASIRQVEQVLSTTTDAVASVSRDWTFTFLNRRAHELLFMKGDLIGRNIWEEFPDAEDTEFFRSYHRTMDEGTPTEFEAYYAEPLNLWLNVACRPSDDGIVIFFRDITERRASDLILRQQRDLISNIQEAALVATWQLDLASGKITYSDGSYPVHGHPLDSVGTRADFEGVVHHAHLDRVHETLRNSIANTNAVVMEFPTVAADGSVRWLETRATFDRTDGVATALRGMTIDISSRKGNEEALAASEERYRVLADLNPQAIWMGSPEGSITYANQGFLDYIGRTLEAASTDDGWIESFYEDDRTGVADAWHRSVESGVEYEIEARMVRASDGAVRWWWLRALPVRDEAGTILNWLGVAIDIHDRRTQADQLQAQQIETERQRAELEAIYATAPIGLALFDPVDFRYLRLNDRQAEFYGVPPSEIIGRSVFELAPIEELRKMFEQVAAGHPVIDQLLEGKFTTDPEGTHRFWTVNYLPVYGHDGLIRAISAASLEITHQKRAENALIQSEKLAAVGRLASSISHEINNPLEAITNLLYLVDSDVALPDTIRPFVEMAQSELSRVCQIATQTLRFHRQAVRATHVTAKYLVDAVLNLYQGRLANSNIVVKAQYDTMMPILCYENDIRQVLNNLIANAIDAMRKSGGQLLIRAHDTTIYSEDAAGGMRAVRISIADTGHGMSPKVQARVFEPFYTTKDLNGTGLGLWISTGIVERHKGRLTLRSSTNPIHHGTVFSLTLPVEDNPSTTESLIPSASGF